MTLRVFVDADVLFSRTLRDWLFLLRNAMGGRMFTVGSSEDVLAETIARVRDVRPAASGQIIGALRTRLVDNLDEKIDEFTVEPWMTARDPGDGHVRAACIAGGFDMLLTNDKVLLADRHAHSAATYEPIRPDEFFVLADDSSPGVVQGVAREQYDHFMKRHGETDLPGALRKAGCPEFAKRVNRHVHQFVN